MDNEVRYGLITSYMQRHGVSYRQAAKAVDSVARWGPTSRHWDEVTAPVDDVIRSLRETVALTLEQVRARWAHFKAVMGPLVEWAQTPEGQAEIAELRAEREAEERRQSCHCLCQVSHGSLGVCNGEAADTLVRDTEALGRVEIPVCQPCGDAVRNTAAERCGHRDRSGLP